MNSVKCVTILTIQHFKNRSVSSGHSLSVKINEGMRNMFAEDLFGDFIHQGIMIHRTGRIKVIQNIFSVLLYIAVGIIFIADKILTVPLLLVYSLFEWLIQTIFGTILLGIIVLLVIFLICSTLLLIGGI